MILDTMISDDRNTDLMISETLKENSVPDNISIESYKMMPHSEGVTMKVKYFDSTGEVRGVTKTFSIGEIGKL